MYYSEFNSPFGKITIVSDSKSLTNLYFEGQNFIKKSDITNNFKYIEKNCNNLEIFKLIKNWLLKYFSGENPDINFILNPKGTNFQKNVWEILKQIPYGKTTTYGDIAKKISKILGKNKMSAQAVGGAVGSNPIPVIIPCHRVIGVGGKLVGYSGGLDIKIRLLKLEKVL